MPDKSGVSKANKILWETLKTKKNIAVGIIMISSTLVVGGLAVFYSYRDSGSMRSLFFLAATVALCWADLIVVMLNIKVETNKYLFALKDAEAVAKEEAERFALAMELVEETIWELDAGSDKVFVSGKWNNLVTHPQRLEMDLDAVVNRVYEDDRIKIEKIVNLRSGSFEEDVRVMTANMGLRWVKIKGKHHDAQHRLIGSLKDINEEKQTEEKIEYLSKNDTLTGLPNRWWFTKLLDSAINEAANEGKQLAVMTVNVDNFKTINDLHGHNIGDSLLKKFADHLLEVVSQEVIISRTGGDEFSLIIKDFKSIDYICQILEDILHVLTKRIVIDGRSIFSTVSIGAAVYPSDGHDIESILRSIDMAMHESKESGKNKFTFFNMEMHEKILRKGKIVEVLRTAVETGSVYMNYQPQYSVKEKRLIGFEALMRLSDGEMGAMSPVEFIPIAEESRAIVPLGYFALRDALRKDRLFRERGLEFEYIAVNIASAQLMSRDFVDNVRVIFEEYGASYDRIHFEITENIFFADTDEKIDVLNRLREIGVVFELDDFGTGYSSLNYIRILPISIIKIDKCFVDEITTSEEKKAMVRLIVQMAHALNNKTVAEGVETVEQMEFLAECGVDIIQGFHYAKSMSAEGVLEWAKQ